MKITLALVLFMITLPAFSSSVNVNLNRLEYYEPEHGELNATMSLPSELGYLGEGHNYLYAFLGEGDSFDAFGFQIADGYQLTSLSLRKFYGDDESNLPELCLSTNPANGSCLGETTLSEQIVGMNMLAFTSMPDSLNSGEYIIGVGFDNSDMLNALSQNYDGLLGYKLEMVVTAVPLPAPLLLFVSGLSVLLGFKRYKK